MKEILVRTQEAVHCPTCYSYQAVDKRKKKTWRLGCRHRVPVRRLVRVAS